MNELRHQNEDINLVLSVGGWDMGTEQWSEVLASRDNMHTFVKEAIVFLRLHDFDCIDLDFEYPTYRGSKEIDRSRFSELIEVCCNPDLLFADRTTVDLAFESIKIPPL